MNLLKNNGWKCLWRGHPAQPTDQLKPSQRGRGLLASLEAKRRDPPPSRRSNTPVYVGVTTMRGKPAGTVPFRFDCLTVLVTVGLPLPLPLLGSVFFYFLFFVP